MPISGWLMSSAGGVSVYWFGYVPLPDLVPRNQFLFGILKGTHHMLARILIVVLALHVAAVLHHDVVRRDGVFRRMWPFGGT
jgi:cytochrome b561